MTEGRLGPDAMASDQKPVTPGPRPAAHGRGASGASGERL